MKRQHLFPAILALATFTAIATGAYDIGHQIGAFVRYHFIQN